MLIDDIDKQFKLLNHEQPSELVALDLTGDKSKFIGQGWAKDAGEAEDWADDVESRFPTASLYIGVTDRTEEFVAQAMATDKVIRGGKGSIAAVTCIVLDIDPIRDEGSRSMATNEQRENAHDAAVVVQEILRKDGYQEGHLFDSGNGIALYLPIPRLEVRDHPDIDRKVGRFMQDLRIKLDKLAPGLAKIDATFDLPRLTRLAGTVNRKGSDQTKWRTSSWI